ncbi:hypothetical protein [Runella zeae]|uniref:hypothetical protein n=1 Tax=Runella zeae TaxID=94255 RepID=UPI0003FD733A|nr:hypothetical protein [Runella zeae]
MFDGIKILNALTDVEALKQNPLLYWQLHVPERTGAIESQTAEYANLRFTIKGNFVNIQGSLHKYANKGAHNYNDFGVDQLAVTINELRERFRISENSHLNNIEFGVNVCTPFAPKKFLERLICHKGRPFIKIVDEGINYYQCQHEHFILKIYDKGTQYRQTKNLLRFEIKVLKMQFLDTKGVSIKTLGNLTNTSNYERLGAILKGYFDEILFDEPQITAQTLKQTQRELLNTGRNPKTWVRPQREDFTGKTEYDRARTEYDRRLSAFRSLIENHPNAEHWQQTVSLLIADKWVKLTNGKCSKFTDLQNPKDTGSKTESVANLPFTLNVNLLQTGQTQTAICKVSMADISGQRRGSVFLGETALRNDAELLAAVTNQHRTNKRKRTKHDAAYYAAHNVRNKHTNPANNLRNRLIKLQNENSLFAPSDVIRLSDEKKELLKRWEGTPYEVKLDNNHSEETKNVT